MRYTRRGLLVLSLGVLSTAIAGADELTTTGGKKIAGQLVAVDAEGVTFQPTGGAPAKVPAKEIVLVDLGRPVVAPAKGGKYHDVELTDGSVVRCGKFLVKGKKLEVELLPGPEKVPPPAFELPLTSVSYALRGADDPKNRDEWKKMLANRGKRDLYVIRQADGLTFVQGTVIEGSPDGATVTFEKEGGGREELRQSRGTGGLVFYQPRPPQVPPTLCKVVDVFGNTFTAQSVEMAGSGVTVKTVSGVVVTYPSAAAVAKLDYTQGNVAYLSDLTPQVDAPEPAEVERRGFALLRGMTQPDPYHRDQLPSRGPLVLDKVTYPKGLCVSVDTALTYNLGGEYRELKATVGVGDALQGTSTEFRLTVEADGKVLFSELIRAKDKARPLALDVQGLKQLRILVERDYPSDVGNYLILADAKVQK